MSSGSERDLRRRFNQDSQTSPPGRTSYSHLEYAGSAPNASSLPPLRSLGQRRSTASMTTPAGGQGSRPSRYRLGDRHRPTTSLDNRGGPSTSFEDLHRTLEDANSHLRSLLDIMPPMMTPSAQSQDLADDSRRIKRRKLDSDRAAYSYKGFCYGKYGQVEPGQLTMEIVSCDGGSFSNDQSSYAAENILKNDASVYCTKGNRCNIVLRHQGSTVFSLKELTVKAPGSNYSAPVREGMVFVSMESDDLLARTEQYQIQYLPPPRNLEQHEQESRRNWGSIYSIRHDENGPVARYHSRVRHQRSQTGGGDENVGPEFSRTAQIPAEFVVSPPPFNITTECSDDDDSEYEVVVGDGGYRLALRRSAPNRIGALPFESDSSDEASEAWATRGAGSSRWPSLNYFMRGEHNPSSSPHNIRGAARNASPGFGQRGDVGDAMTLAEARETAQLATQEAVRAVGGELMAPLVHFHIEKDKSKCTIRFDPPVSGRFILLKMWSPHHDPSANIDVQAVIAKGFAGPRYFPAVELR